MQAWLQSALALLALPEYGLSTLFVVDDDHDIRRAICRLAQADARQKHLGLAVEQRQHLAFETPLAQRHPRQMLDVDRGAARIVRRQQRLFGDLCKCCHGKPSPETSCCPSIPAHWPAHDQSPVKTGRETGGVCGGWLTRRHRRGRARGLMAAAMPGSKFSRETGSWAPGCAALVAVPCSINDD